MGNFWLNWFDGGYMFLRRVEFLRFLVKMDLGSRGPCRVLFTPGNLDITSTGPLYLAICVRPRWQLEEFLHFQREGVLALRCAMPGSTMDTSCASALGCFLTVFFVKGNSDPEVESCPALLFFVTQSGEVCTDDASVYPSRLHLKTGHYVHEPFVSGRSSFGVQVLPEVSSQTVFEAA